MDEGRQPSFCFTVIHLHACLLISPLGINTPFRSGFTCVSLWLAHSLMLNMLDTYEHWRLLTLTHVEGKAVRRKGAGGGGKGVLPSSGDSWLTGGCRNLG